MLRAQSCWPRSWTKTIGAILDYNLTEILHVTLEKKQTRKDFRNKWCWVWFQINLAKTWKNVSQGSFSSFDEKIVKETLLWENYRRSWRGCLAGIMLSFSGFLSVSIEKGCPHSLSLTHNFLINRVYQPTAICCALVIIVQHLVIWIQINWRFCTQDAHSGLSWIIRKDSPTLLESQSLGMQNISETYKDPQFFEFTNFVRNDLCRKVLWLTWPPKNEKTCRFLSSLVWYTEFQAVLFVSQTVKTFRSSVANEIKLLLETRPESPM